MAALEVVSSDEEEDTEPNEGWGGARAAVEAEPQPVEVAEILPGTAVVDAA
jgi:hypothetical protein